MSPFNQDEDSSGVIEASSILGAGVYLMVDQAHELVEGGQRVEPIRADQDIEDARGASLEAASVATRTA